MPDGDLYFIFNEGNKATEFTADFDKVGVAKEWNATDGTLQPINATIVNNRTRLTIKTGSMGKQAHIHRKKQ